MTDEAAVRDWVWLNLIEGIGPRLADALLERFGSVAGIRAAGRAELMAVPGIGPERAAAILAARPEADVDAELEQARAGRVQILTRDSPAYPPLLKQIYAPPLVLYVRGALTERDSLAVAVVGTRRATFYGLTQARRLAGGLAAAGVTVVSGLARGIDAAAHEAALAAGGRTIAVLANGLSSVYPPEHAALADAIARSGAVVSELPMNTAVDRGQFPQRNRLISGLALGVVVVEAGLRSGATLTARHAGEQGREVFAVPGPAGSLASRGCHQLIRDGAKLVESVADILEDLGPLADRVRPEVDGRRVADPAELLLNAREQQVLDLVASEGTAVEEIVARSGLPAQQVASTLTVLEMRRLVCRTGAHTYARR